MQIGERKIAFYFCTLRYFRFYLVYFAQSPEYNLLEFNHIQASTNMEIKCSFVQLHCFHFFSWRVELLKKSAWQKYAFRASWLFLRWNKHFCLASLGQNSNGKSFDFFSRTKVNISSFKKRIENVLQVIVFVLLIFIYESDCFLPNFFPWMVSVRK